MQTFHLNPVWKIRARSNKPPSSSSPSPHPSHHPSNSLVKTIKPCPHQPKPHHQTISKLKRQLSIKKSQLQRVRVSLSQKHHLSSRLFLQQQSVRESLKEILVENINSARRQVGKSIKLRKRRGEEGVSELRGVVVGMEERGRLKSSINAESQNEEGGEDIRLEESVVKILKSSESGQFNVKWVEVVEKGGK